MRTNPSHIITLLVALLFSALPIRAQLSTDTIINPTMIFSGMPKTYEIAGIRIVGADNYEEKNIIGYSGLKVGDRIPIPGSDINDAAKRLWKQGLFSNVKITVDKVAGNKAWLCFNLRQQPRIASIN